MRPRLQEIVTEHLRTVQQQIAEFQLLEQQLAQVLHRLLTVPPSDHAEGCRCLEVEASAAQGTSQQSSPQMLGGETMHTPTTLESFTLLTTQGNCGCGCGCDDLPLTQLIAPQPSAMREEGVQHQEGRTGDGTEGHYLPGE